MKIFCIFLVFGISNAARRRTTEIDIEKSIEMTQEVLNLMYHRYEMDTTLGQLFFNFQQNLEEKDWDIVKYNFIRKILTPSSRFLLIFGGSSVTAGHDNKFNHSYPMVVHSRLANVFQSLDINMEVHNVAQGDNACFPSNWCYESMGGFNPDFVGWEQSFNCGHDAIPFEIAARFVAWSTNPMMAYYAQSGSINPKCPDKGYNPPYSSEQWRPYGDMKPFKPTQEDVSAYKKDIFEGYAKVSTSARFGGSSRKNYPNIAVSGSDMWSSHKDAECLHDPFYYNTSTDTMLKKNSCGVVAIFERCGLKVLDHLGSVYGSESGHGAKWHPTRFTHMLRGELISYLFGMILLDALYDLKVDRTEALNAKQNWELTSPRVMTKFENLRQKLQPPHTAVPPPKSSSDTEYIKTRPLCYTNYRPHYSANMSLSEIIVNPTMHHWTYSGNQSREFAFPDRFHIEERPAYLAIHADPTAALPGKLSLYFEIKTSPFITVCCYNGNDSPKFSEFWIDLNVAKDIIDKKTYIFDEKTNLKWDVNTQIISNKCILLKNIPEGLHVLSIETKNNAANEKQITAGISHLISWE